MDHARCVGGSWQPNGLDCAAAPADSNGPLLRVDPGRGAPAVAEPNVGQPSAPIVPKDQASGRGVVPVSSELAMRAQNAATRVYGFDESHVGILSSAEAARTLNALLAGAAR